MANLPTRTLRNYLSTLPNGASGSVLGTDLTKTTVQPARPEGYATAAQGAKADTSVQPGDLGSSAALDIASQSQAEAGVLNDKGMTPLRTYQELDARLYRASAERFALPTDANTFTGTGTDASTVLAQLAASTRKLVAFPPAYDAADPTTGGILLGSRIFIPMRQKWKGEGKQTKFVVPISDPVSGYLNLNVDANGEPAESYAWEPDQNFSDFYFDARAAAATGKKPVAIKFAGLAKFENLYSYGVQTLLKRVPDGGGKITYSDILKIERVYINLQPSVDEWAIDLSEGNGDAIFINQIAADHYNGLASEGDASASRRVRSLFIGNAGSGEARNIINGDILVWRSKFALANVYQETGCIQVSESDVSLYDGAQYMRHESYGELSVVPLQIIAPLNGSDVPSVYYVSASIKNWGFHYSHGLPGEYSTALVNFSIASNVYARVTIDGCYRFAPFLDARGSGARLGVTCGMTDFDNYSHFASVRSEYSTRRWLISADKGPIRNDEAPTGNIIETAAILSVGLRKWKAASGTRYYKAIFYQDKIRKIGMLGANEVSASPTNGGFAVDLRLAFSFDTGDSNGIFRVYSGSASGVYDKVVDVPVVDAVRLSDNGEDVSSFPWQNMTPGGIPADAVNAGLTNGMRLRPGKTLSTASDAYGECVAYSKTGVRPTCGGWRRGDKVLLADPYFNGKEVVVGFERITNCLSTASTNAANVDWVSISDQKTETNFVQATTAQLTSAADPINTAAKFYGKIVLNTTTNKMVWANGTSATSPWYDFQGVSTYTPV